MQATYGSVCRNKEGRLGVVTGWHYDHARAGKPCNFYGIGFDGKPWRSYDDPEVTAKNVTEWIEQNQERDKT